MPGKGSPPTQLHSHRLSYFSTSQPLLGHSSDTELSQSLFHATSHAEQLHTKHCTSPHGRHEGTRWQATVAARTACKSHLTAHHIRNAHHQPFSARHPRARHRRGLQRAPCTRAYYGIFGRGACRGRGRRDADVLGVSSRVTFSATGE